MCSDRLYDEYTRASGSAALEPISLAIVWALGITWILDGLEVTLIGAISGVLQEPEAMNFTPATIGFIASMYGNFQGLKPLFAGAANVAAEAATHKTHWQRT